MVEVEVKETIKSEDKAKDNHSYELTHLKNKVEELTQNISEHIVKNSYSQAM